MNLTSGKFTATRDGIYGFAFTEFAHFPSSSSRVYFDVVMYLNGNLIGKGYADEDNTTGQWEMLSFQSTLNLRKGDGIWLQIGDMSTGTNLFGSYYTHFSDYLLEENIAVV